MMEVQTYKKTYQCTSSTQETGASAGYEAQAKYAKPEKAKGQQGW